MGDPDSRHGRGSCLAWLFSCASPSLRTTCSATSPARRPRRRRRPGRAQLAVTRTRATRTHSSQTPPSWRCRPLWFRPRSAAVARPSELARVGLTSSTSWIRTTTARSRRRSGTRQWAPRPQQPLRSCPWWAGRWPQSRLRPSPRCSLGWLRPSPRWCSLGLRRPSPRCSLDWLHQSPRCSLGLLCQPPPCSLGWLPSRHTVLVSSTHRRARCNTVPRCRPSSLSAMLRSAIIFVACPELAAGGTGLSARCLLVPKR
mmetsp:Transcript_77488/g.240018  ORF Transcript_77488/g.240018 Transcript_77488/m.240018 type:complete len:257 (-) Transcript_77488:263-1033(-)